MYNSKSLTKSKFNLGGITMGFAFFKNEIYSVVIGESHYIYAISAKAMTYIIL